MSTKALENAVGLLRSISESGSVAHDVTALAQTELKAIRKIARALMDDEVRHALRHAPDDVREAMATLRTIAEEVEQRENAR